MEKERHTGTEAQSEELRKYAYAEVIQGDAAESWFIDLETKAGHIGQTQVSKSSQAKVDTKNNYKPWVEPRLNFSDLLAWMDLNIWHRRAIYVKAAVITGLGWRLVTDDENKEPDAAHKKITDFLNKPNEDPVDSFDKIAYKSAVDLEWSGNFVNEVARTYGGTEIGNLYHQRMVNFRSGKNGRKYYQVPKPNQPGDNVEFSKFGMKKGKENEILHYYTYDPASDFYGMPVWVPALADMLLDRSAVEFNISLFRNQLVAKFAVIVEGGKLSPEAKQSLRSFLASQATGTKNAGRTLIFDTDDPQVKVKIEKLEMDFGTKNDFMGKIREQARDMVISSHGLPPRMAGVVTAGQLGGGNETKEQLSLFEQIEAGPKRSRIADFYNRTILPTFGDHKWKIEFIGLDITDPEVDATIAGILLQHGVILPEEAREDLGYPALDEDAMSRLGSSANLEQNVNELIQLRKRLAASRD